MKTITAYVVAETAEQAECLISGTHRKFSRPFASTLSSMGAARLTVKDYARVPSNPKMYVFPFEVTFVHKPVTNRKRSRQ
jgi:hypothetical protein